MMHYGFCTYQIIFIQISCIHILVRVYSSHFPNLANNNIYNFITDSFEMDFEINVRSRSKTYDNKRTKESLVFILIFHKQKKDNQISMQFR